MKQKIRRLAGVALALLGIAGCSGGNVHSATAVPLTAANQSGIARFSLLIPNATATTATGRKTAFVSPSTLSGTIQVNGGTTTELDLNAGSTNCQTVTGGRTCSINVVAPIGVADTFTLVLDDGAFSGGAHQGTALSRATNFTSAVTEGSANVSLPLVLGGIPASVDVTTGATLSAGVPATVPLIVTAYDAQNNVIVGGAGYVDPAGLPLLTVTSGITTSQVTLHDGPQNGSSIAITAPSDATTLQLSGSADILGVPFTVTNGSGVPLPAHTTQNIAVSGALNPTLVAGASFTDFPDYSYFAPMDATQASSMPNGFVFSTGTQSGGEYLGYFDSGTETFSKCTFNTNFNIAPAAVDGGIGVAYNGDFNVDTPPFGVAFYAKAAFNGSACGSGARLAASAAHTTALGYDKTNALLLEGITDHTFAIDSFTGSTFVGRTQLASYGATPGSFMSYGGTNSYLVGQNGTAIYQRHRPSAPVSFTTSATSLSSLWMTSDGTAYALDPTSKQVWKKTLAAPATALFSSGAFSGSVSTQPNNLTIGPDGLAYTSDAASLIESLAASGATAGISVPSVGGNVGFIRAVIEGKNGYVYAWYDDGLHNGTQYVYRISH